MIDAAIELISRGGVTVLSGAGISTDSGIPDYRGPDSPPRNPITYSQFVGSAAIRRRYWARSHVGWERVAAARPNISHRVVSRLERSGLIDGVITQNVDGLHQAAGSNRVIDLHGRLHRVKCLECSAELERPRLQRELDRLNPTTSRRDVGQIAPDGDADVEDDHGYIVPACAGCGGVLKPDVVFFGENVPKPRVSSAFDLVDRSRSLLVLGSSLAIRSALRFIDRACNTGKPIVIINRGPTRADGVCAIRIESGLAEALSQIADGVADAPPPHTPMVDVYSAGP
ncbi:MAG: NAD-dependent protein deacetylase [Acidimicrobiia bacterium]|nr:NAD-dependent protein deacetylase [Acidimicrobiia bacterium]